jgi:hypothetical protein
MALLLKIIDFWDMTMLSGNLLRMFQGSLRVGKRNKFLGELVAICRKRGESDNSCSFPVRGEM